MSEEQDDPRSASDTTWQRRTASFRAALEDGWRSHRLVPWLFHRARHTEQVPYVGETFSTTNLLPTPEFSLERGLGIDGMGRECGAHMARGETGGFLAELAKRCVTEVARSDHAAELYRVLARVGASSVDTVAILAPARTRLARELGVTAHADSGWLPGAAARATVRGSFEGAPFVAAQEFEATELWVVDFARIGTWQYRGSLDELATRAESLHDQLVPMGASRVLATRITADAHAHVIFEDLEAARGLRVSAGDA